MAKNKVLEATTGIVTILEPLERDDRARVIRAALTLVGEEKLPQIPSNEGGGVTGGIGGGGVGVGNAKAYFDQKEPRTKGEELATAARFREQHADAEASTQAELKEVIKAARRNFDASNFRRDLENARTKGLFNRGTGKDSSVLSHYGQNYVDALPDRDAVKKLRNPKRAGAKRRGSKKKVRRS
jgi:hypothetical protein